MLANLANIFLNVFAPIIVMLMIGVFIDRKFKVDLNTLVKFNLYVFVPAFLFHRLTITDIPGGQ